MAITLRLTSGDRATLERVVEGLREEIQRKGAQFAGPHSDAPDEYSLPLYERLDGDDARRFDQWSYTVYTRRMTVSGREQLARGVIDREYPDSVHVEAELDRSG